MADRLDLMSIPAADNGDQLSEERREADEVGADIRALVAEHGWAAVAVDSVPPFSYTVGLWRMADHPELIVTGLPAETAKWVLDPRGP
jgi:hypothetical protein